MTYEITIDGKLYINEDFCEDIDAYNFALTKYGYIISHDPINNSIFNVIEVETLIDAHYCETCGSDYANGAKVRLDGQEIIYLVPVAHCYNGMSYDDEEIYTKIVKYLNLPITVKSVWGY